MAKGSKRTIIGCSGLPSGHVKMSLSRAIRKGQGQEFLATVLRFVDYSNRDLLFSKAARDTLAKRRLTLAGWRWVGCTSEPCCLQESHTGFRTAKVRLERWQPVRILGQCGAKSGQLLQPGSGLLLGSGMLPSSILTLQDTL